MLPKTSSDETTANVSPAPAQVQPPETNQPGYVTVDQLNEAVNKIQKNFDQLYRGVQSRQDQLVSKVQKQVEAMEGAAKAAGMQLTDAQRKTVQDNALFQALQEQASTPQSAGAPGQAIPQGLGEGQLEAYVNNAADAMQKVWQTSIEADDPENDIMLAAQNGTAQEYLDATYKAIQAKLTRTKGTSPTAQPITAPGIPKSPSVVQGSPQSNPIANITDPDQLWSMTPLASRD